MFILHRKIALARQFVAVGLMSWLIYWPAIAGEPAAPQNLQEKLQQRIDLHFVETTLSELAGYLERTLEVDVAFDEQGLREAGISTRARVDYRKRDVVLADALREILLPLDLTIRVHADGVLIAYREPLRGRRLSDSLRGSPVDVTLRSKHEPAFHARVRGVVMSESGGVGSIILEYDDGVITPRRQQTMFGAGSIYELRCGEIVLAYDRQARCLFEKHVADRNNEKQREESRDQFERLEDKRRELGF